MAHFQIADFRGSWALVTGASSGIGKAFCLQLAAAGINVVLVARREPLLVVLAEELRSRYGTAAVVMPCDLASPAAVRSIGERLATHGIDVRILCNAAAFGHWGRFDDLDAARYERMILLNANALVGLCTELRPHLERFDSSAIINVSSGASFQPVPYMAVYAATKAFVTSFSLALHEELAPRGVLVQTLVPAPTETEFDSLAGAPATLKGRKAADEIVRLSLRHLATGRAMVTNASGTFQQRAFNGLAPVAVVIKTVGKMFRPDA